MDTTKTTPQPGKKPKPPFPPQSIGDPPGIEEMMDPSPQYLAPAYRGSEKLLDKRALITGGDSGIGRSVAVLFAREGADVAIVYLPEEQEDAEITAEAIRREGRQAFMITGDVSDYEECRRIVDEAVENLGGLDILVNNAAFQNHVDRLEDLTIEQWDKTFKTNIYGYFYMVKAALRYMREGGAIINSGSVTGIQGSGSLLDYSTTKGAIHSFTKSLSQSLVEKKIRVNCVAPGPVWTPLNPAERDQDEIKNFGEKVPMKRPAQPEELAPTYVFLASEITSSYITGETIQVFGGE